MGFQLLNGPSVSYKHFLQRIFTDADLFNSRILDRATNDIETIEQFIGQLDEIIPKNRHLVIDLNEVGQQDNIQTDYYFVNHDTRKVFFLDLFEADSMNEWYEARGCNSMKHLGVLCSHHSVCVISDNVVQVWKWRRSIGKCKISYKTFMINDFLPRFFVGLYPDSISLSQKLIGELRDMTHHFIGGILKKLLYIRRSIVDTLL